MQIFSQYALLLAFGIKRAGLYARADEKVDAMRREARGHQKELIRRGLFRKSACQKTRARAFLANPSFSARENLRDDVGGERPKRASEQRKKGL